MDRRHQKFSHFDVVILRDAVGGDDVDRLVVLGISEDEKGRFHYAVSKLTGGKTWMVSEQALIATGEKVERSDMYSDIVVTVRVNQETGEGSIANPDESD